MKLSLLIPTTPDREHFMIVLRREIKEQIERLHLQGLVEVLEELDNKEYSIGWKRNRLLERATGEYLAFIDSDDRISTDYISKVMEGIKKGVDCCSLTGQYRENGKYFKPFIHSVEFDRYWEDESFYYRYPNHLNAIKSSIAKQFRFPEINHGEDTDFATQIFRSGKLKTEHWIEGHIYFYDKVNA